MNTQDEKSFQDIFSKAHKVFNGDKILIHDTEGLMSMIKGLCIKYPDDDYVQCNMNLSAARVCIANRNRNEAMKYLEICRKHIEPSFMRIIDLHETDQRIRA
jgi:hypothetical protein